MHTTGWMLTNNLQSKKIKNTQERLLAEESDVGRRQLENLCKSVEVEALTWVIIKSPWKNQIVL